MFRFVVFLLGALNAAGPAYAQGQTPVGVWMHANKRIQVEITPCGDKLCGRMTWFRRPNDPTGLPLVDVKNTNPALRARPLLGLMILHGLRRTGERTWEGGKIYNPDDGVDYDSIMTIHADGTLHVRAYVLVPLLGKTLIWTRVR